MERTPLKIPDMSLGGQRGYTEASILIGKEKTRVENEEIANRIRKIDEEDIKTVGLRMSSCDDYEWKPWTRLYFALTGKSCDDGEDDNDE